MSKDLTTPPPSRRFSALLESDSVAFEQNAKEATNFLKAISHEGRLAILCRLYEGDCSVTELEQFLNTRQAAVSQQLARLRYEGLVTTRREGKTIYYSIADPKVKQVIDLIYHLFCGDKEA